MAKVSMSAKLNASAQQVWDVIGGFNTLPDWHPAVEKSELEGGGEGTIRRLGLVGGGEIVERLETVDANERHYSYEILQGPFPVAGYHATIRVTDDDDGKSCTVEWESEFDPAGAGESDAVKTISGVYQAGLDNLKNMFGG